MDPTLTLPLPGNVPRSLHRVLLPRVGVNRNFPIEMILLAAGVGSLALKSLELEQGIESLAILARMWLSSTPSSTLLKISLAFLQLEVGSKIFVLHANF